MERIQIDLETLKRPNWSEVELNNAQVVRDFVQQLMNNHDFKYVEENFGKNPYKQHNRSMTDGISGVLNTIKDLVKRYPDYTYDVKHMSVDGDYVIIQSHVTLNKKDRGNPNKGLNIKDTWRVENGKLVEHWDAIQPIDGFMRFYALMTGGKVANNNTLF